MKYTFAQLIESKKNTGKGLKKHNKYAMHVWIMSFLQSELTKNQYIKSNKHGMHV